jgi:hypothetical protein
MKAEPLWTHAHVFCLASGPSLTEPDVERVRLWRMAGTDATPRRVVVANTTFRAAPWADAMFAMDRKWWDAHWRDAQSFAGLRYSTAMVPRQYGVEHLNRVYTKDYRNSGAGCVSLAAWLGASHVYLLGYDCAHAPDGRTHWHGAHPQPLGDAVSVARWPAKFSELARDMQGRVEIVNCSRHTVLDCFTKDTLEHVLDS